MNPLNSRRKEKVSAPNTICKVIKWSVRDIEVAAGFGGDTRELVQPGGWAAVIRGGAYAPYSIARHSRDYRVRRDLADVVAFSVRNIEVVACINSDT